ncbi:MAG: FAD-dependent oxidoreductase [Candidatus Eremiobacteraeota bacterium]|nr:FAD-dependent oxidoreductase [Candidatus Eremiobacteraeota bacterium]
MTEFDVAIVGGGFSGCAVAAHLARSPEQGFSVALFEPEPLGRGAAYGSPHRELLLNTRAFQMSLYGSDPDHFVRWLGPRAGRMEFASRRLYGDYVAEIAEHCFSRPRYERVPERVESVRRGIGDRFIVETANGCFFARSVVLATGNPLPNDDFLPLEVRLHAGYVADPWRFDYRAVGGQVLVIGSGLSALDVVVALKSCGHRGHVHILSRHRRFPEVHADVAPYDVVPALEASGAGALLRSFRRHVRDAAARGFDWRAVVDAIRPESEALWRRLSQPEQRRFERHLRGLWERHRHRAPIQVDAVAQAYRNGGRLNAYAGRLAGMRRGTVTIAGRDGTTIALHPDWIVNCSGVGRTSAMVRDRLLRGMLADGTISADPRGVGLRATSSLAAINSQGSPVSGLWIVGPPARGSRFEATTVPELRAMAELVASQILNAMRYERWEGRQQA